MERCICESCLACIWGTEELAGVTICNRDPVDDTACTVYSAHLAVHFAYGFDGLCKTLDHVMISLVLHFKFWIKYMGPYSGIFPI